MEGNQHGVDTYSKMVDNLEVWLLKYEDEEVHKAVVDAIRYFTLDQAQEEDLVKFVSKFFKKLFLFPTFKVQVYFRLYEDWVSRSTLKDG